MNAPLAGKEKQLDATEGPSVIFRSPFIHPNDYKPGIDAPRWRLVAAEPVNRMARRMIQREISSLNWEMRPRDPENPNHAAAAAHYAEVFRDFRNLASRALKSVCELPQGGAWEVGWMPPLYGEGARGTLRYVASIDAGTLFPTTSKEFPIIQVHPYDSTEKVLFREEELVRILAFPRDEFDLSWWQESPTEANYLSISALSRIYTYSLKQLMDTPPIGILDLMDFKEEAVVKWAKSFRELITGDDPIKIPVLYEHAAPARYISLASDFDKLKVQEQFQQYAEMVLANYGLSTEDLRILNAGGTKAGSAVSQRTTVRSGISFFAELVRDAVQSVLPDFLTFSYSEPDVEELRSMAQIRAAEARTVQTLPWLDLKTRVEMLRRRGVIDADIEIDVAALEKNALQNALAASTSPQGAGGSALPSPRPGQLERGEGRVPDMLEDDAKENAARSPRVFAKSLVEKAGKRLRDALAVPGVRYGRKRAQATQRLESLLTGAFQRAGGRVDLRMVAELLLKIKTQLPRVVDSPPPAPQSKALVTRQDDRQARIEILLDELLAEMDEYRISDEELVEQAVEILELAYEDGLLGTAETVQQSLFARGIAKSPEVRVGFRVVDRSVVAQLRRVAAQMVKNVDDGTRYYLRNMLAEGAEQGLSVDELTDRIQRDLFGLPAEQAGQLNRSRIRSIVTTELNRADSMGRLEQMERVGLQKKRWVTRGSDVCPLCLRNEAAGSVPLDYEYEDVFGATLHPPGHPSTCHCFLAADGAELDALGTSPAYWTGRTAQKSSVSKAFDPNKHPRHPEGAAQSQGGRFAPARGGSGSSSARSIETRIGAADRAEMAKYGISEQSVTSGIDSALRSIPASHLQGLRPIVVDTALGHTGEYVFSERQIRVNPILSTLDTTRQHYASIEEVVQHEVGHHRWMQLSPEQRQRFGELVGYANPGELRDMNAYNQPAARLNERQRQAVSRLGSQQVASISAYGEQNVLESWAEYYAYVDWNDGSYAAQGLDSATLAVLREVSQWG